MIGMKTEAACGRCPLSLLCYAGRSLIVNKTRTHSYMRNKGIPNIYRVRVCKRCLCLIFSHRNTTFICSMVRQGFAGNEPGIKSISAAADNNTWRSGTRYGHIVWTKGCSGGRGRMRRRPHPLQSTKPQHISADDTDNYDCLDHLADTISEVL